MKGVLLLAWFGYAFRYRVTNYTYVVCKLINNDVSISAVGGGIVL